MASHVFTKHESYYNPMTGGIVDFVIGQEIDPEQVILDEDVRNSYMESGSLVPIGDAPFERVSQDDMKERKEIAENPLLADPSVTTDTPEPTDEKAENATNDDPVQKDYRNRGGRAKKADKMDKPAEDKPAEDKPAEDGWPHGQHDS